MLIEVRHRTTYRYEVEANYAIQSVRLTPRSFPGQTVLDWSITGPGLESGLSFTDGFGNLTHLATLHTLHSGLTIEAVGLVDTADRAGVVTGLTEPAPVRVYLRETPRTKPCERIKDLARTSRAQSPIGLMHELMSLVREAVSYETGTTHEHTSASEAIAEGKGVCQDHAHVLISAARVRGIPARYVNGYFISGGDGPAEAHHAWAEAWIDDLGWVGFDASNLTCPTDRYIRLACGLDSASAAPIRGLQRGGQNEALDVQVEVQQQGMQQ